MLVLSAALCAGFGLSGCASNTGELELDPAYWFPDGKKKLQGDRREVFPGGVPGVTQGIPPELVRGNPAQQAAQEQALAPVQPEPQAAEKPKPRPKKVARPRPAPPPEPEPQAQAAPRQAAPRPVQQAPGAWPAPAPQQAQQQQPQPQAPAGGAWPAPPPAGSFTR
jgi:hypothetical protein